MNSAKTNATRLIFAIGIVAVAGLASGCGVRGSLEAPPEAKAAGQATSPEAADAGKDSAAPPKAHRPFILDGLLR